jgi:pyruvate dehydrogenase E1 component beta subunit
MRPVADVQYSDFLFNMMDQLVNQAAKLRYMSAGALAVPMVMRAPVGATGVRAQHAQSPEAFFTHVPGLKVVALPQPTTPKGCSKRPSAMTTLCSFSNTSFSTGSKGARSEKGAVSPKGEVPDEEYIVPIGEATVRRAGKDVTIVASLLML